MNKTELIRQTAKRTRVTQEKAGEILEAALSIAAEALEAGEDIRLKGFGSLELRHRKAGPARNFKTGELMPGKPRTVLSFTASRELRERVNEAKEKRE